MESVRSKENPPKSPFKKGDFHCKMRKSCKDQKVLLCANKKSVKELFLYALVFLFLPHRGAMT